MLTDDVQAVAAVLTALFTAATLYFIARYTRTTTLMYENARDAYEDGTRPVLLLLKVKKVGPQRVAVFKNTGAGIAVKIKRKSLLGSGEASSNVLARDRVLLIPIPAQEHDIIEIRYESLAGRKLCTVSCFDSDGRAFNEFVPDADKIGEMGIANLYSSVINRATLASSIRLLAKADRFTQG